MHWASNRELQLQVLQPRFLPSLVRVAASISTLLKFRHAVLGMPIYAIPMLPSCRYISDSVHPWEVPARTILLTSPDPVCYKVVLASTVKLSQACVNCTNSLHCRGKLNMTDNALLIMETNSLLQSCSRSRQWHPLYLYSPTKP